MKRFQHFAGSAATVVAFTLLALSLASLGCSGSTSPAPGGDGHAAHEHATEGPHGGSLIELGEEEYHAELVHDEKAGTVTIYILDGHAEKATPIEATELTINLKHDGMGKQYKLAAAPETADPAGKSSKFTSAEAELAADLDHEGADAQLVVNIDGKQFRGAVAHDHDHEDHAH